MEIIPNFAVFEGGDGSGTTTQLALLAERFKSARGLPLLWTTFEPTDGPIGRIIRSALREKGLFRPETVARLFAADRNEHLSAVDGILERCRRGELVVSDRYIPSSLVYQGLDCGEALPRLLNNAFPVPETLLFFDLPPETALERITKRPERDIYEYLDFQIRVREAYRALIPTYAAGGVRTAVIDASLPPEEVAGEVWRELQKMPIFGVDTGRE
jgi:dTMP kinase